MFHNINLRICEILLSLPSRERGLKYKCPLARVRHLSVAPFAGAWIEISPSRSPLVIGLPSLPSRERGLKSPKAFNKWLTENVAPFAGAWIEILRFITDHGIVSSLPSRERGLK